MRDEIQKAITLHSHWKHRLQEAVQTGKSSFTVKEAQDCHACPLGKWLNSPEGKRLINRTELMQFHQDFHNEAAYILELALTGRVWEAKERMKLGSEFGQLTARLVNRLVTMMT